MADDSDKTVITERPPAEASTRKIGPYEVVAELGRGGMGTVYRAYEPSLNRYVAIKILAAHLADDEALVGRFAREAKAVAALNHPNIVHIYTIGETEGLPYFVMECIEGETLADLIREKTTLAPKEAARFLLEAASGLAAAHDRGIIHRDIKPSNLMINASGTLKLTDFGIAQARDMGDKLTTTGQIVGTTGYVSPEVFKGRPVDSRSDIFSLGIVLYEMLVGTSPFDDPSPMGLMLQVVEQPVPDVQKLNPKVDKPLADILARMTEKDPAQRYQTCHELIEDLKRYQTGKPLVNRTNTGQNPPPAEPATAPARRRSWPVLLLLLVVGGAGAGWWWGLPWWEERQSTLTASDTPVPAAGEETVTEPSAVAEAGDDITDDDATAATDAISPEANASAETPSPGSDNGESNAAADDSIASVNNIEGVAGTGGLSDEEAMAILSDTGSEVPAVASTQPAMPQSRQPVAETAKPAVAQPQQPVAPAATRTVILTEGDPAITGEMQAQLHQALRDAGRPVLEAGFVPGINRVLQQRTLDIAAIRDDALASGVRYLVVASAEVLDVALLEYYGQRDTSYTTRIGLVVTDLQERETLGNWSEQVQYTNINAGNQTRQTLTPMLRELVEALP